MKQVSKRNTILIQLQIFINIWVVTGLEAWPSFNDTIETFVLQPPSCNGLLYFPVPRKSVDLHNIWDQSNILSTSTNMAYTPFWYFSREEGVCTFLTTSAVLLCKILVHHGKDWFAAIHCTETNTVYHRDQCCIFRYGNLKSPYLVADPDFWTLQIQLSNDYFLGLLQRQDFGNGFCDSCCTLSTAKCSTFHTVNIVLLCVGTSQKEVWNRCGLIWSERVHSRRLPV